MEVAAREVAELTQRVALAAGSAVAHGALILVVQHLQPLLHHAAEFRHCWQAQHITVPVWYVTAMHAWEMQHTYCRVQPIVAAAAVTLATCLLWVLMS
jgi:hypothetical protein